MARGSDTRGSGALKLADYPGPLVRIRREPCGREGESDGEQKR